MVLRQMNVEAYKALKGILYIVQVYSCKLISFGDAKFQPGINGKIFGFGDSHYAHNFEEVEGAYWFSLVRLYVMLLGACETREWLMLGT